MADIVDLSNLIRAGRAGAAAPSPADDALPGAEPPHAEPETATDTETDTASDLIRFDPDAPAPDPDAPSEADMDGALRSVLHDGDTLGGGAPLSGPVPDPALDWTNQELADLYRVQRLLAQAGVAIGTDRGVTDEGDPWFVFLDGQGEVFVHLCRIDGLYLLDSAVQGGVVRGPCFRSLIDAFAGRADTALAAGRPEGATVLNLQRRGKIVTHPGAALAALIWTLYLANDELALIERDAPWAETAADTGPGGDLAPADAAEAALAPDAALAEARGEAAGAAPAAEFEELFAGPQDAADFLAEAKAARDATLRAVTADGRDSLHSPFAALAHPLGATALGLSALAVAYGVTWGVPETEIAALDGTGAAGLPAQDDADSPSMADDDTARGDDTTKVATAAPIFADDPAHEDLHAEEAARPADRAGEAAAESATAALSATALSEPVADGAPVVPENQAGAAGEPAPGTDAAGAPAGSAPRPDETQVAQRDTGTPQSAEVAAEGAREASVLPSLLSGIALPDLAEGEFNVFSFAAPTADAAQGLFEIIDDMIVVAAASPADMPETTPADVPVIAAAAPEESVLVQGMSDTVEVAAAPQFAMYSEEVRVFIDYLVTTSEVEVIAYRNEVLLIDRRALDGHEGEAFARSWSYEDGGIISTVGIRSDFEAFDLTV